MQADSSAGVSLVGSGLGLVSVSRSACITVWPAAYLWQAAEACGFALPSREEVSLELQRRDLLSMSSAALTNSEVTSCVCVCVSAHKQTSGMQRSVAGAAVPGFAQHVPCSPRQ